MLRIAFPLLILKFITIHFQCCVLKVQLWDMFEHLREVLKIKNFSSFISLDVNAQYSASFQVLNNQALINYSLHHEMM
jgi:hypothetical protein